MDGAKRASMREGPLAALFRKTEEPAELSAEESATPALEEVDERADSEAQAESAEPRARERQSEPPHPALGGEQAQAGGAEAPEQARRVRSPRERLRHAFSSDIPGDVMDGAPAEQMQPRRQLDIHDREQTLRAADGSLSEPQIRVVGVGGAGTNAVNRMIEAEVEGVEFLAVNTDVQSLQQSMATVTMHIGETLTRGLGSGSDARVGRQAAMEDYDRVKAQLKGSDMIFIAAGAGGGTGTGAAPIVARIAREIGALTVAIVTRPFGFEGTRRSEQAEQGIKALAEEVDTLIVVPNDRLLSILDKQTSMVEAFKMADDVLRQGVQGISDLVTLPGLINLDFADVRTIMSEAGTALLGIGMGVGENRATDAAMQAAASPLLETSMDGARSILLSITGGKDLSLWEVNDAAKAVAEAAHRDANIIFGAMVDEKLDDQVWVTVVATGYGAGSQARRLEEPAGEPRVKRAAAPSPGGRSRPARGGGLAMDELDVPEFIPHR